jgi:ribonuclease P protein component
LKSPLTGKEGFSRRFRLLKAAEFEAVLNNRCAVRTRYFQVMGRPNSLGHPRLGMIVSKRVYSRAVDRNRIRRLIREAFRISARSLPPLDMVVRPYSKPEDASLTEDLRHALHGAAEKCGAC